MKIKICLFSLVCMSFLLQAEEAEIEWDDDSNEPQAQRVYVDINRGPKTVRYYSCPSNWYRCYYYYYNMDQDANWPTRVESTFYDDLTR